MGLLLHSDYMIGQDLMEETEATFSVANVAESMWRTVVWICEHDQHGCERLRDLRFDESKTLLCEDPKLGNT